MGKTDEQRAVQDVTRDIVRRTRDRRPANEGALVDVEVNKGGEERGAGDQMDDDDGRKAGGRRMQERDPSKARIETGTDREGAFWRWRGDGWGVAMGVRE